MTGVSALIPCFNAEAYVGEALDSVLGQTRAPDEVIVVDDGSTDASVDVVRRFGDRVRLLRQPNRGIATARNTALSKARGDWIAFLDADDLWPQDSLALRLAGVQDDPTMDFVVGLTEEFLSFDGVSGALTPARGPPVCARVAGAALIRRRLFDEVGGFDASLTLGETIDWVARMSETGARCAAIEHLVLRRRVHGDNTVLREAASQTDYLRVLRASLARRAATAGRT